MQWILWDNSRRRAVLWIIIAGSVALSLAYSFFYRIQPVVDAQAYDRIAVNFIAGDGFREDSTKTFERDTAIVRAGPGYEFFLVGMYAIFGHRYEAVWIAQAMLHGATALLLFFICSRVFPEKGETIGLVAAGLLGFHPDLIEISAMLMTETLYLFFVVLGVFVFVLAARRPRSLGIAAGLGILTGIAILTRPTVLLFVPIICFLYWRVRSYRSVATFLFTLALSLAPWAIRNYLVYRQFILTTLIGDYNLWVGNTLLSNGGQIAGGPNSVTAFGETYGYAGLSAEAKRQFFLFVFGHSLVFLKLCAMRTVRFFSLIRPMGFWFYQSGLPQLAFIASSFVSGIIVFVSGYAGMIAAIRERQTHLWYLVAFALSAPLLLLPTVMQSRYRFQIYPFLAIFGAYMIVRGWREKWWKDRSVRIAFLFLLFVSLADGLTNIPMILEHVQRF